MIFKMKNPWVKRIAKSIVVLLILFFLLKVILSQWDQIKEYHFEINYFFLLFSFIPLILYFMVLAAAWIYIVNQLGKKVDYPYGALSFFKGEIIRYIPGTIWAYMGRAHYLKKKNIPLTNSFTSMLLEAVFLVATSALISFISLYPYLRYHILSNYYLLFIFSAFLLILIHPKILNLVITLVSKFFKRKSLEIKLGYSDFIRFFLIYSIVNSLAGIAFILFTYSIYPLRPGYFLIVFGTFVLSWLVGFLFFFVPSGIGIRELTVVFILQNIMPAQIAIIIAMAARLWLIIVELASFGISYLFNRICAQNKV